MDELTKHLSVVEALILASPEPISAKKISDVMDELTPSTVKKTVVVLNEKYVESNSSFRIREIASGYQIYIIPEYTGFVEELFSRRRKLRLTRAALEVMAIVAYKQPVTKTEIELIRGVASDGVLHNLLEKKLITVTGRAEAVGKPLQYGTTDEFLKFFGLNKLTDLPKMEEIEELLRRNEPDNQTELSLPVDEKEKAPEKLNIADGTYDPEKEDDFSDESVVVDKADMADEIKTEDIDETEVESSESAKPFDLDEDEDAQDETEILEDAIDSPVIKMIDDENPDDDVPDKEEETINALEKSSGEDTHIEDLVIKEAQEDDQAASDNNRKTDEAEDSEVEIESN